MHFLFSKLELDEVSTVRWPGEPNPRAVFVSLNRCILCTWVVRSRESSFKSPVLCWSVDTSMIWFEDLHVHRDVFVHTWVLLHVRTCTQGHVSRKLTSGIILLKLSILFLRTGSLTGLEYTKKLDWWVRNPEGSACLCLSSSGLLNHRVFVCFFKQGFWVLNLDPHSGMASSLLTESSPGPQCIQYNMEKWKTNNNVGRQSKKPTYTLWPLLEKEWIGYFFPKWYFKILMY